MTKRLKSIVKTAGDPLFWPQSRDQFCKALETFAPFSGKNAWELTQHYQGGGWYRNIYAFQVDTEYQQLVDWAIQQNPARIMEIGTATGATLMAWCRIATQMVISVDLPGGIHGGGYPVQRQPLYKLFPVGRDIQLHLLQDNSQIMPTRQKVEQLLGGEKLDILYIDGDHTLAGVTADYELWSPLVRPGGHIVFHDVAKHTRNPEVGVDTLWNRLKQQYPHTEFVHDPNQGWAGIGVLHV